MSVELAVGDVQITAAVVEAIDKVTLVTALRRHASGDWGNVEPEDAFANNASVDDGTRVLSRYRTPEGRAFWILTEADRSRTTILFPEEY